MKLSDEDKIQNQKASYKKYYIKNLDTIREKNRNRYSPKKTDDLKIIQAKIESSLYLEEVKKELENI